MKIYLAHPLGTRKEMREWELQVEKKSGHELVNPFYDLEQTHIEKLESGEITRFEVPVDIVPGDIECIKGCDALIAYINGDITYGTIMEIVYAYIFGVPVYLVVTNGYEDHPWLRYHSFEVYTSLEDIEKALGEIDE